MWYKALQYIRAALCHKYTAYAETYVCRFLYIDR